MEEVSSTTYELYFAIGSMVNKVSLNNRKLYPVESNPAELLDYELGFFGQMGMAVAEPKEGSSFHGVLHKLTEAEMISLDGVEAGYARTPAKAKLYDGTVVDCTVYTNKDDGFDRSKDKPPTERYR